ncbi:L,D-transpeptidase [Tabrizicola sp. M-4]|uniref:L,D-transpeptidase n=1 Tax=Tabrizicola sp. M-4 TaxID=3055847 RepID=UPI003DA9B41B
MPNLLLRLIAPLALLGLAACADAPKTEEAPAPAVPAHYQAVQDGEYLIPAVEPLHLFGANPRAEVEYAGSEEPGTIVVDTYARVLYHVQEGGRAMRYGIAVGREGISFRGTGYVGRKQEWPSWTPTANMVRTRPDLYAEYAGGLPGGLDNPLGARALYLYRGGRDTMFRIHGTIDNASIGRATSAGCIRLFNQDAIHLFENAEIGDRIVVRTLEQSLAAEGPYMDDAYGRAVPDTPENRAQFEADRIAMAEAEVRAAEEARVAAEEAAEQAAKDERRRLRICRNRGIDETECPTLSELTGDVAPPAAG